MQTARTVAMTAAICLAIGAAITIAIALCLWHFAPLKGARSLRATTSTHDHVATVDLGVGVERIVFTNKMVAGYHGSITSDYAWTVRSEISALSRQSQSNRRVKLDRTYMSHAFERRRKHWAVDNWYGFSLIFSRSMARQLSESDDWSMAASQAGWPWPSLYGELTLVNAPAPGTDQRLVDLDALDRIKNTPDAFALQGGAYPKLPLLPGFIYNTLLYAALTYLLIPTFAFKQTRTYLRTRRNLCTRCAYPLRDLPSPDSPCPECGKPETTS